VNIVIRCWLMNPSTEYVDILKPASQWRNAVDEARAISEDSERYYRYITVIMEERAFVIATFTPTWLFMPMEENQMAGKIPVEVISDLTLQAIRAEAMRAHYLHGTSSMFFSTDPHRLSILAEEFGEVAKEINEARLRASPREYRDRIEKELIQVAAMAASWIEALSLMVFSE
jgi:hypothetical protein